MSETFRYDKKERRAGLQTKDPLLSEKFYREREFNIEFNPILNPLTSRGHEIAIYNLFVCMKSYIPIDRLSELKKDFLSKIIPVMKEERFNNENDND